MSLLIDIEESERELARLKNANLKIERDQFWPFTLTDPDFSVHGWQHRCKPCAFVTDDPKGFLEHLKYEHGLDWDHDIQRA